LNILVVEDENSISDIVMKYLNRSGYEFEALALFAEQNFHLVILDIMMPGINGFEVLKRIRDVSEIPVIMLTAKQEEIDRLKGFEIGADDYVVKPFSPKELVSRVKVFMKRVYNETDTFILKVGEIKLFPESMKVEKNGLTIELTGTEYKLLYTFMRHKGQVLSRDQIIEMTFGVDYCGFDRNVDTYIKRLRDKIEDESKSPKYLITKYGLGYVFGGGIDDNS